MYDPKWKSRKIIRIIFTIYLKINKCIKQIHVYYNFLKIYQQVVEAGGPAVIPKVLVAEVELLMALDLLVVPLQ